jgi:tRNA(Ile)-lysidine synthase
MLWKPKSARRRNSSVPLAELTRSNFYLDQIFESLNGMSRLALAVSGGSDSMAMLRMVHEWASTQDKLLRIFVLTVDHGLREVAGDEAKQVAQWCAGLGIAHETLRWDGQKPLTGIQAKARAARYDLMSAWCIAHDVPALLTAHTADDQAETVVMRSARTSSAKSLAGIWPERDWNGVRVLRPLLGLRRADLRSYLNEQNQNWIDDPSNDDVRFERVRVRQALAGDAEGFAEQALAAQRETRRASDLATQWCDESLIVHETGFLRFSSSQFASQIAAVQDEILLQVIGRCGSSATPELQKRLDVLHWLVTARGCRRALGGVIFAKRKHDILVGREPGRISAVPLVIPQSGQVVWDHRFHISAVAGALVVPAANLTSLPRRKDIPAFIQAGLPVVLQDNEVLAAPYLGIGTGVSCKFLRY